MYSLACRDAGLDCSFVAKGENKKEVLQMGMEHVKKVHPEKAMEMEEMSEEESLKMVKET